MLHDAMPGARREANVFLVHLPHQSLTNTGGREQHLIRGSMSLYLSPNTMKRVRIIQCTLRAPKPTRKTLCSASHFRTSASRQTKRRTTSSRHSVHNFDTAPASPMFAISRVADLSRRGHLLASNCGSTCQSTLSNPSRDRAVIQRVGHAW
jgi:hypothetical protein